MLASAHGSFRANNRWGVLDASALLEGIEQFVALNKGDATWVAEVGEAFRSADASGDVAHASSIVVDVKPSEHAGSRGLMDSESLLKAKLNGIYSENRENALEFAERAERDGDSDRAEKFRALADPDRDFLQITDDPEPRVSEVVGDLASAENVTMLFPGTGTTIGSYGAKEGRDDAVKLLRMQEEVDRGRNHAVIDSLSFEAPTGLQAPDVSTIAGGLFGGPAGMVDLVSETNLPNMLGDFADDDFLQAAGDELFDFVDGVPLPDGATVNAVGHSYGTTALGQATVDHPELRLKWDNVVGAGSPGMVADRATDLSFGDVFMAAQRGDPISGLDNWGEPYGHLFGAQQLGTHQPGSLIDMPSHSMYFSTEHGRLREIAEATTDQR